MANKFRKKPVVVEAVQFFDTVGSILELDSFMGEVIINYNDPDNPKVRIETLEGDIFANVGDYIIKGVKGEFYPCRKDIFEETYDNE